jgi:hypothetical protein
MGTLNVYQWSEQGALVMLLSRSGDQGALWRFAQATLQLDRDNYRVSPCLDAVGCRPRPNTLMIAMCRNPMFLVSIPILLQPNTYCK